MKELDIGKVAEMTGLAPSALRHYETRGLIKPIGRNGLRRQYNADVIDKLRFIRLYRMADFTLKEIATLFDAEGRISLDRALLNAKAESLEKTIFELSKIQDSLQHMVNCPESDHMQCPQFIKILRRGEF